MSAWLWCIACVALAAPLDDQARVTRALKSAGELDPDRGLALVAHVCDLVVDGERFPVVDVRELVRGASTPRGVNRIVVLDRALRPVQRIPYEQQRPLFCRDNRLYLWDAVRLDDLPLEGNVLVFTAGAARVEARTEDVNDWPIYP